MKANCWISFNSIFLIIFIIIHLILRNDEEEGETTSSVLGRDLHARLQQTLARARTCLDTNPGSDLTGRPERMMLKGEEEGRKRECEPQRTHFFAKPLRNKQLQNARTGRRTARGEALCGFSQMSPLNHSCENLCFHFVRDVEPLSGPWTRASGWDPKQAMTRCMRINDRGVKVLLANAPLEAPQSRTQLRETWRNIFTFTDREQGVRQKTREEFYSLFSGAPALSSSSSYRSPALLPVRHNPPVHPSAGHFLRHAAWLIVLLRGNVLGMERQHITIPPKKWKIRVKKNADRREIARARAEQFGAFFSHPARLHVADCYLSVPLTHPLLSRDFVKIQYVRSVT